VAGSSHKEPKAGSKPVANYNADLEYRGRVRNALVSQSDEPNVTVARAIPSNL
jgi:hypothetical protein